LASTAQQNEVGNVVFTDVTGTLESIRA
jgi:hypothetical protein